MMEYWNVGVLVPPVHPCSPFQYSIIPLFQCPAPQLLRFTSIAPAIEPPDPSS